MRFADLLGDFADQRASLVLLADDAAPVLDNARLFVEGMEDVDGFETVTDPAAADAILVRLEAPFENGRGSLIGEYFHGGTLAFPHDILNRVAAYAAQAPLRLGSPGMSRDRRTAG
jgi:beta-glucosidase